MRIVEIIIENQQVSKKHPSSEIKFMDYDTIKAAAESLGWPYDPNVKTAGRKYG